MRISWELLESLRQKFKEGLACVLQFLFQPCRAIAIAARPRLGSILVAAFAPVVRILYLHQLKILFPIRSLLLQGSRAIAHFHPAHRLICADPRLIHVSQVFVTRDRPLAQRPALNRARQRLLAICLHPRSYQVSHTPLLYLLTTPPRARARISRSKESSRDLPRSGSYRANRTVGSPWYVVRDTSLNRYFSATRIDRVCSG